MSYSSSDYDATTKRIVELEYALSELLECVDESPAGYAIETEDGEIVNVSGDLEDAINRASAVLYREEDTDE